MSTLAIKNLGSEAIWLRDFYMTLAPGQTRTVNRTPTEMGDMRGLQEYVNTGQVEITVTLSAEETTAGGQSEMVAVWPLGLNWRPDVPDVGTLNALTVAKNRLGDLRVVTGTLAAYVWNGAAWVAWPNGVGGVVPNVVHGLRNNGQTTELGNGDHITFANTLFTIGSNITLDTASPYSNVNGDASVGRITLAANRVYKLTGNPGQIIRSGINDGELWLSWYNATTGFGNTFARTALYYALPHDEGSFDFTAPSADCVAYIAPTVETLVELRIVTSNGEIGAIGYSPGEGREAFAWFTAEDLGPSA